jgi:hypothetical protein
MKTPLPEAQGAKMCTVLPSQQVRSVCVTTRPPHDSSNHDLPIGRFIPTRRTQLLGASTSDLLGRIVAGYGEGDWDAKRVKIGLPKLTSRAPSRAAMASRPPSRQGRGSGWRL